MVNNLSLSTSWHYGLFETGSKLVAKTIELGFSKLEINFKIKEYIFEGIKREWKEGSIIVSSLHNICPVTEKMEKAEDYISLFSLSASDEDLRKETVKLSERTLINAAELEAKAVIFHLGEIEKYNIRQKEKEYRRGFKGKAEIPLDIDDFFKEIYKIREKYKAEYIDNIRRSLDYLVPVAEKLKIIIGIENRYYLSQIPQFEEIDFFLNEYDSDYVGFWYDIGHAFNLSNLGYWDYLEYFRFYADKLIGMHIHDCIGISDHLSPGMGNVDFDAIEQLLPDNIIKVLELKPSIKENEILEGVRRLKETGII